MKNLLIAICIMMGTTLFAQEVATNDEGVFKFETEIINYGNIQQNADGNRLFTFKNIGDSAIIITNVKASCGCTVATKPNKPILPGETAEIGVNYTTSRIGTFSKSITITSNASEKTKVLRIKGNILDANHQDLSSAN